MGTIIVKTCEDQETALRNQGALIYIPEELWELSKKHKVYLEDTSTGERVLVIDMNPPAPQTQVPTLQRGGDKL